MVDTTSVSVKELDRVHLKKNLEGTIVESVFADAVETEEDSNVV